MKKGLNSFILLFAVVALLVIAGGAYYFMQSNSSQRDLSTSESMQGATNNESSMDHGNGQSFIGTVSDLLNIGKDLRCTFDTTDQSGNHISGTVYISGKMMRGNFSLAQTNGATYESRVIKDQDYLYLWSPDQQQGTKIKADETEQLSKESTGSSSNASNEFMGEQFDYSCTPWAVDQSLFVPPSTIEFVDFSDTMQQLQNSMQPSGGNACDTCNQLPAGEARDQCLQALNCQ